MCCKRFMLFAIVLVALSVTGCGRENDLLNSRDPVEIIIWHHYTGIGQNAFYDLISIFNETVGMDENIVVRAIGIGSVRDIEIAVSSSVRQEVGSLDLPNIFMSFPDTAYTAKRYGLLVNLDDYFSSDELERYFPPFIERGRIGFNNELHIFPAAMSTEVLMLNHTDWLPFAAETGVTYSDLETIEGVVRVASIYYEWSGGRAFFGRDQFANLFVIGSKQFGVDIKILDGESVVVNVDKDVMRRIWDTYYVPRIRGYFAAYGRFRSEDLRVGDVIAYSGSNVSAAFFPDFVTTDDVNRDIVGKALPAPIFAEGENVMVQQGAGMVIVKSTTEKQSASSIFLRWFTEPEQSIRFSALSGHLPVKTEIMDYALIRQNAIENDLYLTDITDAALRVALEGINAGAIMYTPPSSFAGAVAARGVLYNHLRDKARRDRAAVVELIQGGTPREEAIAQFNTDENFEAWLYDFTAQLQYAAK